MNVAMRGLDCFLTWVGGMSSRGSGRGGIYLASPAWRSLTVVLDLYLGLSSLLSAPFPPSFPGSMQRNFELDTKLQLVEGLLDLGASAFFGRNGSSACTTTSDWPGWAGIKNAFIFGDSYSDTDFNTRFSAPSLANPLGNPSYPGRTSSNGPNWVDFLTVKHNASLLMTYNLAFGGATVDADLVKPYAPHVLSLKDQICTLFADAYTSGNPQWASSDTLFGIWIGINDVGNSFYRGPDATSRLNQKILAVYGWLIDELYAAGARNFVFLNVPPVHRSPMALSMPKTAREREGQDILQFNGLVVDLAKRFKNEREVNVWVYDSYAAFTRVLDDPASSAQTAGYKNVTGYCKAYQSGTPQWDSFFDECGIPVDEYFWLNGLHPTYPIHDVVAEGVAAALRNGPNVCPGDWNWSNLGWA